MINKKLPFISIALITLFVVSVTTSCVIVNPPAESSAVQTTANETTSTTTVQEANSSDTTSKEITTQETSNESTSSTTTSTTTTSTTNQNSNLTQQEAIDIALTVAQGTVERVETEIEHGKLIWKVRIVSDGTRTDVRIDDATGKIVAVETKND